LAKYGDRQRANIPTAVGSPIDVDMGSDQYGWHRDAVKVAKDRINQIHSSQKQYLRGARPYELLNLRTNRGAIVPFGINSMGGKFLEPPQRASEGELRGGIMFTKAGQDYLQDLLNKRQKQYAEMYAGEPRTIPTSNTEDPTGEVALSAVYPLYDSLLDDLRTFNVKSVSSINTWWAMMLTTLPILGSNFRPQLKEIVETLGSVGDAFVSHVENNEEPNSNPWKLGKGIALRLQKAIKVIWLYIGSTDQNEEEDERWDANATYNGLFEAGELPMRNGHPISEPEWKAIREDMMRNNLRHLIPQYGKAPIDAPASVREELVRKLNKEAGLAIPNAYVDKAKDFVRRLIEAEARGETEDVSLGTGDYESLRSGTSGVSDNGLRVPLLAFPQPQGATRLTTEAGMRNQSYDADGEFRPRTGRLEERPTQTAVATDLPPRLRQVAGLPEASGQGRPRHNFQRKPTRLAEHHRLKNSHNERR